MKATLNEDKQVVISKDKLPTKAKISLREHAGEGTENITAKDQKLPILKLLHSSSPVLEEGNPMFNEKARAGDIYNEVSQTLYGKSILAVPCHYINTYNEWAPKGQGVGRPTIHLRESIMDQCTRSEQDKKDYLPNGNYVEDTGNHFCYIVDEKTYEPLESVLITMKMSQKSKSKGWNSTLNNKTKTDDLGSYIPPSWSSVYKLSSIKEENTKEGYKWHGWSITFDKWLDENKDAHILEKTKGFYETVSQNAIFGKVDFEAEMDEQDSKVSKQKKPAQVTANTQDDPF